MQTAARREQFTPIFQHTDLFPVFVTLHPGTMLKMNLPELTLCLLGTGVLADDLQERNVRNYLYDHILLCRAATVTPSIPTSSGLTSTVNTNTPAGTPDTPNTPAGTPDTPNTPAGTPVSSTGTTVSSSGDTAATGTSSTSSTDATESVGDSSSGLSSGAIAGITIGSIAGVAAVGGGIFGALKYTGRI